MSKRILAASLWFLAGWSGGGLLVGLYGLPSIAAFAPGILLAGLVWWDPTGALWKRASAPKRRVLPINDFADELDREAAQRARGEAGSIPV